MWWVSAFCLSLGDITLLWKLRWVLGGMFLQLLCRAFTSGNIHSGESIRILGSLVLEYFTFLVLTIKFLWPFLNLSVFCKLIVSEVVLWGRLSSEPVALSLSSRADIFIGISNPLLVCVNPTGVLNCLNWFVWMPGEDDASLTRGMWFCLIIFLSKNVIDFGRNFFLKPFEVLMNGLLSFLRITCVCSILIEFPLARLFLWT